MILELKGIKKSFDGNEILKGINLAVEAGEFITLLGPSGCGKTTTLRIIAGLEYPDEGSVSIEGSDVTAKQPEKRDVNTVFQSYALFPHMTIAENIAYGLKIRKVPKEEQKKRVKEALELVQLAGFEKRKPSQLSGGQRQRVAIARAIVNNPKVLLLDEPLGALDLQLRRQMQIELKRLQKKLGITFIYITHDQEEAINMSDRIAVMNQGVFEQIGTPDEIYDYPKTDYAARFVGNANVIKGKVAAISGTMVNVAVEDGFLSADCSHLQSVPKIGADVFVAVRSERLQVETDDCEQERQLIENGNAHLGISCTVEEIAFAGGMLRMTLRTDSGQELVASRHGIRPTQKAGDRVCVSWEYKGAVIVEQSRGGMPVSERKERLHD